MVISIFLPFQLFFGYFDTVRIHICSQSVGFNEHRK